MTVRPARRRTGEKKQKQTRKIGKGSARARSRSALGDGLSQAASKRMFQRASNGPAMYRGPARHHRIVPRAAFRLFGGFHGTRQQSWPSASLSAACPIASWPPGTKACIGTGHKSRDEGGKSLGYGVGSTRGTVARVPESGPCVASASRPVAAPFGPAPTETLTSLSGRVLRLLNWLRLLARHAHDVARALSLKTSRRPPACIRPHHPPAYRHPP